MIISILICSLANRSGMLSQLLANLNGQIQSLGVSEIVEVLVELDNGERTTGAKRDALLRAAKGKYVIYIDDDDHVYPCYVSELLNAANSDADCFGCNGIITTDGHSEIKWKLSKDYPNMTIYENGKPVYIRATNHITAVKREIALKAGFPNISNGEDKAYSEGIHPHLKSECVIIPPIYHYQYLTTNKTYK